MRKPGLGGADFLVKYVTEGEGSSAVRGRPPSLHSDVPPPFPWEVFVGWGVESDFKPRGMRVRGIRVTQEKLGDTSNSDHFCQTEDRRMQRAAFWA